MKRFLAIVAAAALSLLVIGAQAQKMGGTGKMGMVKPPPGKGGVIGTSTGTVQGAPTPTSFVLKTAKGDVTVSTIGARYRNASGQYVKADKLTPGASVEVTGQWRGKSLTATNIKISSLKAAPSGGKMGGDKMGGKMSGGKMSAGKK